MYAWSLLYRKKVFGHHTFILEEYGGIPMSEEDTICHLYEAEAFHVERVFVNTHFVPEDIKSDLNVWRKKKNHI